MSSDGIISERVASGHRQVSILLDRCLGPFALFVAALSVVEYFRGHSSFRGMAVIIAIPVFNILATNIIGIRIKNAFYFELARSIGMNSLLGTAAFLLGEGALAHYWPVYLTCSIFGSIILYVWTRSLLVCYLEIFYWTALMSLANWYLASSGIPWMSFSIIMALTSLVPVVLVRMCDLLTVSLENEDLARSQLAQSSKMAALGEMAGGIAHEVNTPLAVIGITVDQLLEMQKDHSLSPEHLSASLNVVLKTTDRIAKIVAGLRTFSRDGSQDPLQDIHLKQLIDETILLCQEQFNASQITLIVEQIPDALCVKGRAVEVSQILLNLLSNARYAVKDMSDKWVRVSVVEKSGMIEIQVTDSGLGIPDGVREKVFQPFFTTKEVGRGTGLGLSVSLGIAKKNKGNLLIDTTCKNTRFLLQLTKS